MKGKTIFISLVLGLILWIPAVQYACNQRAVFGIGSEILLPFMFVGGAYFMLDVFETVKNWYWYYRKKKQSKRRGTAVCREWPPGTDETGQEVEMKDNQDMLLELSKKVLPKDDDEAVNDLCLVLFDVYNHILHCEKSGVSELERKKIIHFLFDENTYDEDYLYAHARVLTGNWNGPGGDLECLKML